MTQPAKWTLVLFLICGLMAAGPIAGADKTMAGKTGKEFNNTMAEFRTLYKEALAKDKMVGSSFRFIHGDEVLAEELFGLANVEENRKIDENSLFHWASITKTLTGIAIMQLRDRGLLSLDDPIIKYIPELREVHNPYGDMGEITIRHLMTHTSGFRGGTWPWKDKPWQPHEPLHFSQLVAMFPYTEIEFKPGTQWSYSNPGIIFLGRVIELLTTDDWEVYINKNIFMPLGMTRSYFDHTPYHLWKDKTRSYTVGKDGTPVPADPDVNTGITVSNGGLSCPVGDFVKYVQFLLGDAKKQAAYDGVLKRASLEEMWRPAITLPAEPGSDTKSMMGLTFFIQERGGVRLIWHSGGQNAYASYFFIHPESRTGYVVAYNSVPAVRGPREESVFARVNDFVQARLMPLFFGK